MITAFLRALRDPFPHSRLASLMALAATKDFYLETDCATKIIPFLAQLLVDPNRYVESAANDDHGIASFVN